MERVPRYDLVIAGGDVVDPGGGHLGRYDVAVHGGRIAAVAPGLARYAAQVVDGTGGIVTPGLVDLHTHIHPGATYWGIAPDPLAWSSGVTTWVDAGTAGGYNLNAFRQAARGFEVRVAGFLNISAIGLTGRTGECEDIDSCDVDLAIASISANRDLIIGVKVRMDRHTVGRHGVEPLRRALTVGRECGVPVMVHVGYGPPDLGDGLPLLRPGDIITHCATGVTSGRVQPDPALVAAYHAGVRFDIGHGAGGFAFDVIEAQLEAGLTPHTVSSDLHARSVYGPVFDLPTTMTKLLAVGLPLEKVVAAATVRPAEVLGPAAGWTAGAGALTAGAGTQAGAGTLAVGAPADIAVFDLVDGEFEVSDAHGQRRTASRRLVNRATYLAGRPLPPRLPEPPPPWIPLTDGQRAALVRRERAVRDLLTTALVAPEDLAEQFPRPPQTGPGHTVAESASQPPSGNRGDDEETR
ncbi:MAG: amidohydrolase family protein [Micromonosporaceae bacterium]